jgi:hypothetical protein
MHIGHAVVVLLGGAGGMRVGHAVIVLLAHAAYDCVLATLSAILG